MSKETEAGCGAVGAPVEPSVRPLAWIVRHVADRPGDPEIVYRWEEDAARHAASFNTGIARVIALGDIAAAVAAERERLAQVVRDFPHWLGDQAKRDLLAAMGFEA